MQSKKISVSGACETKLGCVLSYLENATISYLTEIIVLLIVIVSRMISVLGDLGRPGYQYSCMLHENMSALIKKIHYNQLIILLAPFFAFDLQYNKIIINK